MFDAVIVKEVIEHVHDPVGLMRSVADRLAPGGSVFLSTPAADMPGRPDVRPTAMPAYRDPWHVQFFTLKSVGKWLAAAGLRDARYVYVDAFYGFQDQRPEAVDERTREAYRRHIEGCTSHFTVFAM